MKIKENILFILMIVLFIILILQNFNNKEEPIVINIPASQGSTDTKVIEVVKPIYIREGVRVDSTYKAKYDSIKDKAIKDSLYYEAIRINDYKKTVIDDDKIKIDAFAQTRGSLLNYKIDYIIKPQVAVSQPKIIYQQPRLSAKLSVEGGLPLKLNTNFILKGDVEIINKSGNGISLGYDTDNRVWLGVSKTFKIKK